jgi:hypothetical protein
VGATPATWAVGSATAVGATPATWAVGATAAVVTLITPESRSSPKTWHGAGAPRETPYGWHYQPGRTTAPRLERPASHAGRLDHDFFPGRSGCRSALSLMSWRTRSPVVFIRSAHSITVM